MWITTVFVMYLYLQIYSPMFMCVYLLVLVFILPVQNYGLKKIHVKNLHMQLEPLMDSTPLWNGQVELECT